MREWIVPIISAIFGGSITAFFNYRGKLLGANTEREDVYADHIKDLFKRLDDTQKERDELKEQNIELRSQIKELTKLTQQLKAQVHSLSNRVTELTKAIKKEEKINGKTNK